MVAPDLDRGDNAAQSWEKTVASVAAGGIMNAIFGSGGIARRLSGVRLVPGAQEQRSGGASRRMPYDSGLFSGSH